MPWTQPPRISAASPATPPVCTTTGPATTSTFSFFSDGVPHQRGRLPHGRIHLPLARNAVGHEGEREAVALLRFRRDADAAQPDDDVVARRAGRAAGGRTRGPSRTTIMASMR